MILTFDYVEGFAIVSPEHYAWIRQRYSKLLHPGKNSLEDILKSGEPPSVVFVDLATGQAV